MEWNELMKSVCWMVDVLLLKERGRALKSEWQTGCKLRTGWEAAWKFNKALINSKKRASR